MKLYKKWEQLFINSSVSLQGGSHFICKNDKLKDYFFNGSFTHCDGDFVLEPHIINKPFVFKKIGARRE